jgi:hypothetical protein
MEGDPLLRRIERDAAVACGAMALAAWALQRGRPDAAIGVLAGGLLSAISYGTIKGTIDAVMGAAVTGRPVRRRWWAVVQAVTRYGVLAAAAYVMIVRLRLSPAGVIAGASSLVVATGWEAVHGFRSARPAGGRLEGGPGPGPAAGMPDSHGKD